MVATSPHLSIVGMAPGFNNASDKDVDEMPRERPYIARKATDNFVELGLGRVTPGQVTPCAP
jgi:hypothetical protein